MTTAALALLDEVFAELVIDPNISITISDKLADAIKLLEEEDYPESMFDDDEPDGGGRRSTYNNLDDQEF